MSFVVWRSFKLLNFGQKFMIHKSLVCYPKDDGTYLSCDVIQRAMFLSGYPAIQVLYPAIQVPYHHWVSFFYQILDQFYSQYKGNKP